MQTIDANWEDEENNRQVAFAVAYIRKDQAIEIQSLTPKQVTFLCPESRTPKRAITVWTDKGRQLLATQLKKSGQLPKLQADIEASLAV